MPTIEEQMQNLPLSTDIATQEELNVVDQRLSNFVHLSGDETLSGDLYKFEHINIENPLYERYVYRNDSLYYCSDKNNGIAQLLSYMLYGGGTGFNDIKLYSIHYGSSGVELTAQNPLSDIVIEDQNEAYFSGGVWGPDGEYGAGFIQYDWSFGSLGYFEVHINVEGDPTSGQDHISSIWGDQALYQAWQLYTSGNPESWVVENGQIIHINVNCRFTFSDVNGNNSVTANSFDDLYNAENSCFEDNQYIGSYDKENRFALSTDVENVLDEVKDLSSKTLTAESDPKFSTWKNNYGSISANANGINIGTGNTIRWAKGAHSGIAIGKSCNALSGGSIAIGFSANSPDEKDIAIGEYAFAGPDTHNVSIGHAAGANKNFTQSAIGNVCIGTAAGSSNIISARNNIWIGESAGFLNQNIEKLSNAIVIGAEYTLDGDWSHTMVPGAMESYAIQLGCGVNNEVSSFQVHNWKVLDQNGNIPYARLSSSLSGYVARNDISALSDIYVLSDEVIDGLSNVVAPKLSTIANLVSAEVERVDEISSNYVPLTAFQALEARVSALESRLSDYETIIDQINGTN